MDNWTLNHMNKWLGEQFYEEEANSLRPKMIWLFNTDPEFWANQSYWKLHDRALDACRER